MPKASDWTGTTLRGLLTLIMLPFRPFMVLMGSMFRPRSMPETQDIVFLRVADAAGNEIAARIEGDLRRGDVQLGDEIELWGHFSGGVLIVSRGYNCTSNAEIRISGSIGSQQIIQLVAIVVIILVLFTICSILSSIRMFFPF